MRPPTVEISPRGGSMRVNGVRFYTYGWGDDPAAEIAKDMAAYDAGESPAVIAGRRGLRRLVLRRIFAACGVRRSAGGYCGRGRKDKDDA